VKVIVKRRPIRLAKGHVRQRDTASHFDALSAAYTDIKYSKERISTRFSWFILVLVVGILLNESEGCGRARLDRALEGHWAAE